ncbi:daunorubicin resistance protein DrrA family ABC transporter ATP-binding protein [Lactococcus cremoris]|uniref:daunorubicin resistance protein DrrA family ABC transporter ATP-binding protein n=1 Tax=Lactococcus lactis subsp. cremoris TaxID=1359 RepID=UPI0003AB71F6|nr:daunorubicin resistance protein DrrA family ABC transporter ATP-binding protein [Lactococcus cremoris]AGV72387.1 ABC transporter ATP-binding protein [Lactococcus cremoris subsp. cremoris KW2]
MALAISTTNLVKNFEGKNAVNGISLDVHQGEIFGILGPNGAGKTTFLRMLATLTKVTSGSASIFGNDLTKDGAKVRNFIGLTGQYASVDEELTGMENMIIFGQLNGLSKKEAKKRGLELLKQFSLTEAKDKSISAFSGGMRRRLDLAVSLITKPPVIFLDEPTTGLDPRTRGEMWKTIRELVKGGSTIVLTTQYLDEADQLADRIAIIDHGSVIAQGTPSELKNILGETTFELSLIKSSQIKQAKEMIEQKFNIEVIVLPEFATLSIKVTDTKIMTQILLLLETEHIAINEFETRKPTLDEVFLELTGK